jgi:PAS domain-containing protein
LNNIEDGVLHVSSDGEIRWANEAAGAMLGRSPQLFGDRLETHFRDPDLVEQLFESALGAAAIPVSAIFTCV